MTIDELYYCFFIYKAVGKVNAEETKASISSFSFSFGTLDINKFIFILVHSFVEPKFDMDTSW